MNEKPLLDPRNVRPAFYVEKENKALELDAGMRTCVGYPTEEATEVCGTELPRGIRYYCSGDCMKWAKKRGEYRHD
jgi:hypothetical protein